jgi:hypothetical protein
MLSSFRRAVSTSGRCLWFVVLHQLNEYATHAPGVNKGHTTMGPGAGLAVNEGYAASLELLQRDLDVLHCETEMVNPLPTSFQEPGYAGIVRCWLYQLYVAFTDRQKGDTHLLVADLQDLCEGKPEADLVGAERLLQVVHDDADMIDLRQEIHLAILSRSWPLPASERAETTAEFGERPNRLSSSPRCASDFRRDARRVNELRHLHSLGAPRL